MKHVLCSATSLVFGALLPVCLSAGGCITPLRSITLSQGAGRTYHMTRGRTYHMTRVQAETKAGKYFFTASALKRAGVLFSDEATDVGVAVLIVTDDFTEGGRLILGEHCRVYLTEFYQPTRYRWRATAGSVGFRRIKICGIHLLLNITLERVDKSGESMRLTGNIDFEERFDVLRAPQGPMKWALEEEDAAARPYLLTRPPA